MLFRLLAFVLCMLPVLVAAEPFPRPTSDTVNDFADVLKASDETALAFKLKMARKKTGVHVVVVTIASRDHIGFGDMKLEPFATGLFNDWGIGDATRNDGVMILVLPEDREMRIELGTGFPPKYDQVAQRVIEDSFLPAFRKGRYDDGILTGTEDAIAQIVMPFAGKAAAPLVSPKPGSWDPAPLFIGLFVSAVAAIYGLIWAAARFIQSLRRCAACGLRGLERRSVTVLPATEMNDGREEVTQHCPHCGHTETYTQIIPRITRSRSSGGSGFGGGRSSGGGASGRW